MERKNSQNIAESVVMLESFGVNLDVVGALSPVDKTLMHCHLQLSASTPKREKKSGGALFCNFLVRL